LDFLLGDFGFALLDGSGVDFVDIFLLVVGFEGLDDFFNDSLFVVGVHPGEDDAGGPAHLQVLHVFLLLLCVGQADEGEYGYNDPVLHHILNIKSRQNVCICRIILIQATSSIFEYTSQPEIVLRRKRPRGVLTLHPFNLGQLRLYFLHTTRTYLNLVLLSNEGIPEYPDFK